MLCSYCEELTVDKLLELYQLFAEDILYTMKAFPDEFYTHRPSFQSLSESARDGCEICQAFMDAFTSDRHCMAEIVHRVSNRMDTTVKIHIELDNKYSETPHLQVFDRLFVKIGWDESNISNFGSLSENRIVRLSLTRPQTSKSSSSRLDELRVGEPFRGYSLSSPELQDLSREWLLTCVTQHSDEYCPPLQEYPLPTRLIDIGSVDGVECPKLITASGKCGLYVALSHCWGSETPLRTTAASIEQHCLSLPINIIPKTFLDAMTITRELGFRYLWIDSLCIIQDSKLDWEQESAVMDDVYRNAAVTIAAAASRDSKAGIFDVQEEKPKYYAPLKLNFGCLPIDCVYISSFKGDETIAHAMFHLPLATRGWTLQERVLSQRVLHYGRRRIYWQCREGHISADGNAPKEHSSLNSASVALLKLPRSLDTLSMTKAVNNNWLKLVKAYCTYRTLSYNSDKLPAMAGTARALHNITGDVYMAGIWRGDWARGVLWKICSRPQMVQNRAPSWSWARWDGGLIFQMIDRQIIDDEFSAQLTQYHIDVQGKNPFGEVASGSLHLKAWVKTTRVKKMKKLGYIHLDDFSDTPNQVDKETVIEPMARTKYTVVLIGRFLGYTSHETPLEHWTSGMLVLKPVPTGGSASFERVGTVYHVDNMHGDLDMTGWTMQELTII